ncbi:MAG TPA: ATP-binding protein, partial [Acidimicrobiales bacterium]|nr:ATP-binding protein [Acidimicrobiales bacterium]
YVVTLVALSLSYAAVVVGLGWTFAGSNSWFPAAAGAALVGILSQPVLLRVRAEVDRRFRVQADPFDTAKALGRELEHAPGPVAVARALCESTRSALDLPWVEVRSPGGGALARVGSEARVPTRELPLGVAGGLGTLVLAMRSPSEDLDPREVDVATHLATQAALALRAASHAAELEQERDRSRAVIDADRDRLRRDIHDELAARVTGASYAVRAVSERLKDERDRGLLAQASDDLASSVREMRRLAADVRPHALEELGLVEALRAFARTSSAGATAVTVVSCGETDSLPTTVELAIYRVALEAISNALRHAAASRCEARLQVTGEHIVLTVTDDGIGGAGPFDESGTGLRSMSRRATEVGGACEVRPTPTGTIVTMTVPRW